MRIRYSALLASVLILLSAPASAHLLGMHGAGLDAGVIHPFTGIDHLLAMLAVGMWAAQQGGRAQWSIPLAFVAMMTLGGILALTGVHLPMVETGIATSVLVLGLLVTFCARLPLAAGATLVGIFALFHGHAHGAELPLAASPVEYALGFILATAALHGIGIALGNYMKNGSLPLLQLSGAAVAATGVWLMLSI
ncbi:MAG TPA: HupE/UreJ family protein [Sulfuriferula sp.]|nr:HupE/UreJ family protein [Sulfuriferula sp.]